MSEIMTCQQLAACIGQLKPDADPQEVARLCLLLTNTVEDIDTLLDKETLLEAWQQVSIRFDATTDQHAAMTDELEELSSTAPNPITMQHVWVLLRAIKVQSQVLQLYLGPMEGLINEPSRGDDDAAAEESIDDFFDEPPKRN